MTTRVSASAGMLRRDLCARNAIFAQKNNLTHAASYGTVPVIVYAPEADGKRHGNFADSSYTEILKRPEWARRMQKIHTQARRALPRHDRPWRELDSCMSSDALLMNVFCWPGVCGYRAVASLLGTETTDLPEFGHKARVPRITGGVDRTEVDMRLGRLLVESKLTEKDFQSQSSSIVESYRDLTAVFDVRALPRADDKYISYQLIRNVLAAFASDASFCVIVHECRTDLIEAWHTIMRYVRHADMRTRCQVLTWQELSAVLPGKLSKFLEAKYGIVSPGSPLPAIAL